MVRRLCWFVLVAGMALGGTPAWAATVSVQVADRGRQAARRRGRDAGAGRPVSLPVKPMSGVEIAQSQSPVQPAGDGGHGRHAASPSRTSTPSATTSTRSRRSRPSSSSSTPAFRQRRSCSTSRASPSSAATSTTHMVAWVVVVDTPLVARSAAGGKARIDARARRRLRAARLAFAAGRAERRRRRRRSAWPAPTSRRGRRSPPSGRASERQDPLVAAVDRRAGSSLLSLGLLLAVQLASFVALRASLSEHAHRVLPESAARPASACCRACSTGAPRR